MQAFQWAILGSNPMDELLLIGLWRYSVAGVI